MGFLGAGGQASWLLWIITPRAVQAAALGCGVACWGGLGRYGMGLLGGRGGMWMDGQGYWVV